MNPKPTTSNTLIYGDNLPILREYVPSESVDLVYLAPPIQLQSLLNVLFKDEGDDQFYRQHQRSIPAGDHPVSMTVI